MITDNLTCDPSNLNDFAKDIEKIKCLNATKPESGGIPSNENPDIYEYTDHVVYSGYDCVCEECDFGFSDDVISELEWVRKALIKCRDILDAYKNMCDDYCYPNKPAFDTTEYPNKDAQEKFLSEVQKIKSRVQDEIYDIYYKKIEYRSRIDDTPVSPEQIINEVRCVIIPYARENLEGYDNLIKISVSPVIDGGHNVCVTLSTNNCKDHKRYKSIEAQYDGFGIIEHIGVC